MIKMENYVQVVIRKLAILLNAMIWLFVLYFSLYEDEKAAFLSYVAVTFSVFVAQYAKRRFLSTDESFVYTMDVLSKFFTLSGIYIVVFSQFWNTAFYLICLGILIQKIKYEVKSANIYPCFYKLFNESSKTHTSDQFIKDNHMQFGKVIENVPEMEGEKLVCLKENECCTFMNTAERNDLSCGNTSGKKNCEVRIIENCIEKEIQISESDLNVLFPGDPKTLNVYKKKIQSPMCNFQRNCLLDSDRKDILHVTYEEKENERVMGEGSTPYSAESLPGTHNVDLEKKILELVNKCVLQVEQLNLQEHTQREYCNLDKTNIERKINEAAKSDVNEKLMSLSNDEDKFNLPMDKLKQPDTLGNETEYKNVSESEHFNMDLNLIAPKGASPDCEIIFDSCVSKNSNCDIKQKFNLEYPFNGNTDTVLFNDIASCDAYLQQRDCTTKITSENLDKEKIQLYEANLRGENFFKTHGISDSIAKFSSKSCTLNSSTIQPEIGTNHKVTPQIINLDDRPERVYEKQDSKFRAECEMKALLNYHTSSYLVECTKNNEMANDANEKSETNETLMTSVGKEYRNVSNVEDVVNRIDMGFIYSLGFNVPV